MKTKYDRIVIVGYGWIGQANALALVRMGYDVYFYDIVIPPRHYAHECGPLYDRVRPLQSLLEKDGPETRYLVCVGDRVSDDGIQDISVIEKALEHLRAAHGTVILRSTVLPASLAALPFHYYLPEFLHERYAVEECYTPFYFVLGKRSAATLPAFLREWQSRARKVFMGTPEEASYIKYLSNLWNAVRIAFVNEFGDAIADPVDDAHRARTERVVDFVLERKSYLRYGRGFGGHCLPKDMRAFTAMAETKRPSPLLRGALLSNAEHEKAAEAYRTLPEWFSSWEYDRYSVPVRALINVWRRVNAISWVRRARSRMRPIVFFLERLLPARSPESVKRRWEAYARQKPYYYSHPDTPAGKDADEFDATKTGEADVNRFVRDDAVLREHIPSYAAATLVEIGAGVGRMTEHLAPLFREVIGIDISRAMLDIARKRLGHAAHVTLLETAGTDVPVPSNTADAVFSYEVFRHLPDEGWIGAYMRDIYRVLKSGGVAKLHLRTGPSVHRWWWFYGVSLQAEEAKRMVERAGFSVLKIHQEGKHLWLWLKKV